MSDTARVFRTGKDSKAGLYLEDGAASLIGDKRHFITVDDRGVTIRGPISIVSTAESIRTAGLFVGLNDFLYQLPSTIVTPLPKNISMPPNYMMANVARDVAFFLAFLV